MPAHRPRTRQPEIRPDQILDAAQGILLSRGAQAMTMDAVAEAAGIGKGTIYNHYASKAELMSGLRARYLARTVAQADATARQGRRRHALARVDRFLQALMEITKDNGELLWILFHQAAIEEENELAGIYEALLGLVQEGIERGELAIPEPEFTTGFLLHGFHGMAETAFHRGPVDVGHLAKSMRRVTRSSAHGPDAAAVLRVRRLTATSRRKRVGTPALTSGPKDQNGYRQRSGHPLRLVRPGRPPAPVAPTRHGAPDTRSLP